ncbi:MAG: HAMP domain-containing histidine kinase [Clostridia bacterium]|nr:HAMP domain-containing histidine kinase [Clostridia bacterium]MBR5266407.1 HAMP domain-containing histidine kinase [Clostridia bacterium]
MMVSRGCDLLSEYTLGNIDYLAEILFADDYFETAESRNMIDTALHSVNALVSAHDPTGLSSWLEHLDYIIVDDNGKTLVTSDTSKSFDEFLTGDYIVYKDYEIFETGGRIPPTMTDLFFYCDDNYDMAISFGEEYWGEHYARFDEYKRAAHDFVSDELGYSFILLLCLIYFIIVTGRKPHSDELHTQFIDRVWTEVHIVSLFLIILFGLAFIVLFASGLGHRISASQFRLTKYIICISFEAIFCLCLWLSLSLVRKIKGRTFFRSSFCGWFIIKSKHFFAKTKQIIRTFSNVQFKDIHFAAGFHKLQSRFVGVSVVIAILISFCAFAAGVVRYSGFLWLFGCVLLAILEFVIIWHYMKKTTAYAQSMTRLLVQIDKVSSGQLDYDAGIYENDFLRESSEKLSNITDGLSRALDEQMKGERMKIELVTNVSHDLKTPLTSIISYIDLLKKEEMGDVAQDYVGILANKADRLKGIVSDLFDLAKANSGNAQVDIEPLDFARLAQQTLADMEDRICISDMAVKTNLDSPAMIMADGRKLSRALTNVLDNALRYSLAGSRIYVDLVKNEGKAVLSVKNTSASEMDFTADEIMQRFVRGDKNRSTDGSGLGLSIARSFTEVSGGRFDVAIDGDQFKAVFTFNLHGQDII